MARAEGQRILETQANGRVVFGLGLGALEEMTLGNTIYWSQQSAAVLRGYWWWWGPPIVMIALIFIGLFLTSVGFDRFANPRLARR